MRMFVLQRTAGVIAAALISAWGLTAAAGDTGVVRIADRSAPAVVARQ